MDKPREDCWYTKSPIGNNTLARTLTNLFRDAGIEGHFTNHSLRATAATRMFDAGVDEQLIMSRTGHSSTVGVRSYKRITSSLKEKTSNVLNGPSGPDTSSTCQTTVDNNPINKENDPANVPSNINFSGATNFTVNFHF